MTEPVKDRRAMIAGMSPELCEGRFVFCTAGQVQGAATLIAAARAMFREEEGLSLLLPVEVAQVHGLPADLPMRQITLTVYSSLEGVGLTAAVAAALAEEGIPCNMIAATLHDHVFVPETLAQRALEKLVTLARGARAG